MHDFAAFVLGLMAVITLSCKCEMIKLSDASKDPPNGVSGAFKTLTGRGEEPGHGFRRDADNADQTHLGILKFHVPGAEKRFQFCFKTEANGTLVLDRLAWDTCFPGHGYGTWMYPQGLTVLGDWILLFP
jgi:hypothetical protein